MTPIRRVCFWLASIALVSALNGCEELLEPCYNERVKAAGDRWNGVSGNWQLVTIDNRPLPYVVPFSDITPLGRVIAKSGSLNFSSQYRYFADDCESIRAEKGSAYVRYAYSAKGVDRPEGTYAGSFDADYDNNSIVLSAGDSSRNVSVTSWDIFGRPNELTAVTPVQKWGVEAVFVLVFRRGEF